MRTARGTQVVGLVILCGLLSSFLSSSGSSSRYDSRVVDVVVVSAFTATSRQTTAISSGSITAAVSRKKSYYDASNNNHGFQPRGEQRGDLGLVLRFALRDIVNSARSRSSSSSDSSKSNNNKNNSTNNNELVASETTDDDADDELGEPKKAPGSKLRTLKDLMWVRETLEDLTAAEFACTVEAHNSHSNIHSQAQKRRRSKRAVDYEKLLNQLNKRLLDLGCEGAYLATPDTAEFQCALSPDVGMGNLTYSPEQRQNLLDRIVKTRLQLIEVIHGNEIDVEDATTKLPLLKMPELPTFPLKEPENEEEPVGTSNNSTAGPKLYVRDDGTVDWDGALQDQSAMREFGIAVWARINGRDLEVDHKNNNGNQTEMASTEQPKKEVTAKITDTPEIREARDKLDSLRMELVQMERDHTKLLNSAIAQGQATANIRLAAIDPQLRSQIKSSSAALDSLKIKVSFQTLLYELERIYTYLAGEIGNPSITGYMPLQDRLNVAEFGLLESQIDSFNRQFMDASESSDAVDEDVLAVVFEQLTDFKRRLGIDYYVTGLSFADRETIGRWLGELWVKTKKGLAFYYKGVQLFWNDVVYTMRLINRAAQGYTLRPREVRTIRRTFKDIITFIPFVIILLIPLSPVGHVLVFGAIQRFFPDFFPSCFTEQRQNLLQLYETAEYSELTINETWQQKLSRLSEAFLFLTANALRNLYFRISGLRNQESSSEGDQDQVYKSEKKQ